MNETWILYLFTRVDELKALFRFIIILAALSALFVAFITAMNASDRGESPWQAAKRLHPGLIVSGLFLLLILQAAVPSQRDLAIIIGGKFAVEAAQSSTAKKLLELVNATIDSELEKASGKRKEQK